MSELVTYASIGSVAHLTLDDGKANALGDAMLEALTAAVARAEREAQALVVAGRPERFSAGFDLKVMTQGPVAAAALLRRGTDLLMRLWGCPLPVVVACTGHALAGGALLALTGDVVIGARGAYKIGLNEVQIGMPVPHLAIELARARLAPAALTAATLRSQIYDPDGAQAVGYLDRVVAPDEVVPRALEEAARLAALARSAFAGTKERLRGAAIARVRAGLDDDLRALLPGA